MNQPTKPVIDGFDILWPSEIDENDSVFWGYDCPAEIQFCLVAKKRKYVIYFLMDGMYYTEAMRRSAHGSLKECIDLLEDELGEKVI